MKTMSPKSFCSIFVSTCEYLRGRLSILEEMDERNVYKGGKKGRKERKRGNENVKSQKWREGSGAKV
jgi:hypothetical protein